MGRTVRLTLMGIVGVVVFPALLLLLLMSHQPNYYVRAGQLTPEQAGLCLDQFRDRACQLTNQVLNETQFDVTFTEDQVNAWLAGEASWKYRDRLPEGVEEVRVAFRTRRIVVGAQVRRGAISSIASVHVQPVVLDGTAVGLRVRRVRAGALPMPLSECKRLVRRASRRGLVEWREQGGDAWLMVHLPKKERRKGMRIELVAVGSGLLRVKGVTGRSEPARWPHRRTPASQRRR